MYIKIFGKQEQKENPDFLKNIIVPKQTHSSHIIEIKTGKENLKNCDGIFTAHPQPLPCKEGSKSFKLGIKTADCSAIVFEDKKNYGIIHAGWRGTVNGIIEKMLEKFENPKIFVAPFLKKIEIQKDFCYDAIFEKFGDQFFEEKEQKIIFDFEYCLKSLLGEQAIFDERDTLDNENFYSYRRNKTERRNYTVIGK